MLHIPPFLEQQKLYSKPTRSVRVRFPSFPALRIGRDWRRTLNRCHVGQHASPPFSTRNSRLYSDWRPNLCFVHTQIRCCFCLQLYSPVRRPL